MASSPSGGRERQASNAAGGPSSNLLPPPALPLHLQGKNITVESIFYEQQKMALGTACLVQDTAKGVSKSLLIETLRGRRGVLSVLRAVGAEEGGSFDH